MTPPPCIFEKLKIQKIPFLSTHFWTFWWPKSQFCLPILKYFRRASRAKSHFYLSIFTPHFTKHHQINTEDGEHTAKSHSFLATFKYFRRASGATSHISARGGLKFHFFYPILGCAPNEWQNTFRLRPKWVVVVEGGGNLKSWLRRTMEF